MKDLEEVIKERIRLLEEDSFAPEGMDSLKQEYNNPESLELIKKVNKLWAEDLKDVYRLIYEMQETMTQYEDDLIIIMNLKKDVDQIAQKVSYQGFDEKLEQLVTLLEQIKPKSHLRLVKNADIIEFPDR